MTTITNPQTLTREGRRLRPVGILGTGVCTPPRVLDNQELESLVETSDDWIRERTGMRERRIAADDQATSDLAIAAGREALAAAGLAPSALQLIVVATATPDHMFPPTACFVQHALGAKGAAAFDVTVACSSFINALMTADALVAAGTFDNALVIGADKLSAVTDYTDRNTCVLFGDAGGAVVLGTDDSRGQILDHVAHVDGSGAEMIQLPAGGSRKPASAETVAQGEHFLKMDGKKVFRFATHAICDAVQEVLARNDLEVSDLDLLVPHQANLRIIEAAGSRLGLPPEKVAVNIERYGNTSSASVPLALHEAIATGRLRPGQLVCLAAFGGGLSWCASLLRW